MSRNPRTAKQRFRPVDSKSTIAKNGHTHTWEVLRTSTGWTTLKEAMPHDKKLRQLAPKVELIIQEKEFERMAVSKPEFGDHYILRIERRSNTRDAFNTAVVALVRRKAKDMKQRGGQDTDTTP